MKAARDVSRRGVNFTALITRRSGGETCETGIDAGPAAAPTTAVWAEVALFDPDAFVAVTTTRIVCPTSLEPRRCDWPFWPKSLQLLPALSQRRHWKEYLVGEFVQVPVVATRSWPSRARPLIVGAPVAPGSAAPAWTRPTAAEVAVVEPNAFLALTWTRIVLPTSPLSST